MSEGPEKKQITIAAIMIIMGIIILILSIYVINRVSAKDPEARNTVSKSFLKKIATTYPINEEGNIIPQPRRLYPDGRYEHIEYKPVKYVNPYPEY